MMQTKIFSACDKFHFVFKCIITVILTAVDYSTVNSCVNIQRNTEKKKKKKKKRKIKVQEANREKKRNRMQIEKLESNRQFSLGTN